MTRRTGSEPTLAEICIVACAQAWRGDGAILASPIGLIPGLAARLARLTFEPDLLLTDGEAALLGSSADGDYTEGWLPYRDVFRLVAAGKRHVMMGAAQLDRFGNQNISCIGDWNRPKAQLLGVRGAPGNTINHPVSYWIPRHSRRVFVSQVDMVSGVGYDRAAALGARGSAATEPPAAASPVAAAGPGAGEPPQDPASMPAPGAGAAAAALRPGRFHDIRVVVTDKAVLDFATPDHSMRVRSLHPGVSVGEVRAGTGFELAIAAGAPATPMPTTAELTLIRHLLDPTELRERELA